jgi:hypothetical protein
MDNLKTKKKAVQGVQALISIHRLSFSVLDAFDKRQGSISPSQTTQSFSTS